MIGRSLTVLIVALGIGGSAAAGDLSTSALRPTALGPTGVVEASFPEGGKTTFYVVADVKPGDLLAQIGFEGRRGAQKAVDMAVLDGNGRSTGSFWVHGEETAEEKTRSFPIDATGKQVVRLEVEGPPTARFRVEIGGTALAGAVPKPAPQTGQLSRSIFTPTTVGPDGVVSGPLPGADRRATYYLALDVKKGELLSQISVQSRAGAGKSLDFALLGEDGAAKETYWVHGEGATEENTRSFPIDSDGRRIVRLVVEGPETATFKVELGGSAVAARSVATDKTARAAGF